MDAHSIFSIHKKAGPFVNSGSRCAPRIFVRRAHKNTLSDPTSTVGSAEASSFGPRPAQSVFRNVHAAAKNGLDFFARCCGANSVRLERGAPGFAGHSSFARLYKASRFRAAARNVFYGKAKRTVQTKRSARFFFVTPVSSSGSAPLRRGRPRGRGWPRGGWCRRWASPCRDCPDCRDCPADPASPGYSPEW